jgi:probable addiction module antidote protein
MNPIAATQLSIKPCEAADYLQSDEGAALFTKAVGDIARARGMMQLVRDTGITREGLYKALRE